MKTSIVPGSLQAMAQRDGMDLAESFLSADALVLVDVSGSMDAADVYRERVAFGERMGQPERRYAVACAELRKLQASLPGRVAVMGFASSVEFCPGGLPRLIGTGTDLAGALRFAHAADGCGISVYVISDGEPNDEAAALAEARRFTSPIHCIFIGNPGDLGANFLRKLATASGGQFERNSVAQLAGTVERLMLAAAPS